MTRARTFATQPDSPRAVASIRRSNSARLAVSLRASGSSSVGRAFASQAKGRRFESGLPLQSSTSMYGSPDTAFGPCFGLKLATMCLLSKGSACDGAPRDLGWTSARNVPRRAFVSGAHDVAPERRDLKQRGYGMSDWFELVQPGPYGFDGSFRIRQAGDAEYERLPCPCDVRQPNEALLAGGADARRIRH